MRAALSRRALLLAALPLALSGCGVVPDELWQAPTATPAEPRRVRVSRAGSPALAWTGGQVQIAGERVGLERGLRYAVEAVPLTKTSGEVRVAVTDPEEWPAVFASQIAIGTPADSSDLVMTDSTSLGALARARALQDLGTLLKDERWHKPDEYLGGVLRAGVVRGQQLALPLMASVEMLVRNGPMFDDAALPTVRSGWDWPELLRAARVLTRRGRGGRWGIMVTPRAPSFVSIAWQQGAVLVTPDGGRMDLTESSTVRALDFLAELVQGEQVAPAVDEQTITRFGELWGSREVAMAGTFVRGPVWWHVPNFAGTELVELPEQKRGLLGVVPILVGIPRAAPDLKHSLAALRGLVDGASSTLLLPARKGGPDLRQVNSALGEADAAAMRSAVDAARFMPGDFPLGQIAPFLDRELLLPVLSGQKPAIRATRDVQPFLDKKLADLRG